MILTVSSCVFTTQCYRMILERRVVASAPPPVSAVTQLLNTHWEESSTTVCLLLISHLLGSILSEPTNMNPKAFDRFTHFLFHCRGCCYLDFGLRCPQDTMVSCIGTFWKRGSGPLAWMEVDLFVPGWLISWSADHAGNAAALWPGENAEDEVHRGEAVPQPWLQPCWGLVSAGHHPGWCVRPFQIFRFFFFFYFSVRSTNIVRTIESAKCLVAGLFQQKQKGRASAHKTHTPVICSATSPVSLLVFFCLQTLSLYWQRQRRLRCCIPTTTDARCSNTSVGR